MKNKKKVLITPISKRPIYINSGDQLLMHNRKPKIRSTPGPQS